MDVRYGPDLVRFSPRSRPSWRDPRSFALGVARAAGLSIGENPGVSGRRPKGVTRNRLARAKDRGGP